jgi:SAM-dependent methyltransferase
MFIAQDEATEMLEERWRAETERLTTSWEHYEPGMLATYLVSGVEDPRINIQSILTRDFLLLVLFGERFAALKAEELRFATVMDWLLNYLGKDPIAEEMTALVHALENGAENAEGVEIPFHVLKTFQGLPRAVDGVRIPNYIRELLSAYVSGGKWADAAKDVFGDRWAALLANEEAVTISVIEAACGSANDYRFLKRFGIARFLDYTGFDLCEKNVENAGAMFPGAHFVAGNVLGIDAKDKCFDYCVVQDLLEHLSVPAMEQAIKEICRVTCHGICVGFFQMDEIPNHVVRRVGDYHINLLSMEKVRESFEARGAHVEVIHIQTFLRMCLNCAHTHNPNAYTFYISF